MSDIARIRNVAFVGPHHAGKTSLIEALLAHCGAIARRGSVQAGTTVTDCEPEAISHVQSVCTGFAQTTCGDLDLTLIDTPGFIDFFEETKRSLVAADAAVVVIDAEPERVAQSAALFAYLKQRNVPHLVVVNKLDRPGADYAATLEALRARHGGHVVALDWPVFAGGAFTGYVDLADGLAFEFGADGDDEPAGVPAALRGVVDKQRGVLLEALADFDDHLMEELLDGLEPTPDDVRRDLCDDCMHDQVVAVLCAAALTGAGAGALVRAIAMLLPSPDVAQRTDIDGRTIVPRGDGPLVAQVCKTIVHPQSGKFSVVRIFTGTLDCTTSLIDASRGGEPCRPAGLYRLFGKRTHAVSSAGPGSIVAVARLDNVATGETLVSPGSAVLMPFVPPADPLFALAIKPREKLDESKLSAMLARIVDEDPTLRVERAALTGELQLLGNGEMHVTTATERLARKYHLILETHAPSVPYRETITAQTVAHARYKHQTGGHGQFADVTLRIRPAARGAGVTFAERIVGGVVPKAFFAAVERGVREALASGPVAGFPVVDLHVELIDGAYHAVDSSEAAFRTAAAMAIRDGLAQCAAVLLEPLVRLEARVPADGLSAAAAQLTSKRGHIMAFDSNDGDGFACVHALVPQAELGRYITELRTITSGLGTFRAVHERFEVAPERVAAAVR